MSQNVKAGLFSLVTTDATISGMIGTRMFPVQLPEATQLPAIRYTVAGGQSGATFDASGGPQRWRVQFDCIGADHPSAEALRNALTDLLDGFFGTLSDGTYVTIFSLQPIDFFDSDPRQFRCAQEFYINFNRNPS